MTWEPKNKTDDDDDAIVSDSDDKDKDDLLMDGDKLKDARNRDDKGWCLYLIKLNFRKWPNSVEHSVNHFIALMLLLFKHCKQKYTFKIIELRYFS